ncbi:MAG: SDR family oxidoreductase [Planctomycetota bacterium]|jgi:NAD(P)-dependent dehydrogenase (short-subunit alcohol dehydrogenase family)
MHVKELFSLKGKVAIVTGGEGKYGKCIVEGLAEADATVISASPFVEEAKKVLSEYQKRGLDIHVKYVDLGESESIKKMIDEVENQFGGIDVLVNNAVTRPMKGYNAPIEQFAESMRINATGLIDITRQTAEAIAKRGGGSIVNICSMMGMYGPDLSNYDGVPEMGDLPADYFFHKGGMFMVTRYFAKMFAGKGMKVRINSISPGGILADQPEQFLKNYTAKVPVGRMANDDDIKGTVVFLASQASAYIDGENILMDGGMRC